MSKRRKKKGIAFLNWVEKAYGTTLPPEMETYIENLRNLKPTEILIQTPRGYYIHKEPHR